jgi:hypothetical protein
MPDYARLRDAVAERVAELLDAREFAVAAAEDGVIVKALQGKSAGSTLHLSTHLSGLIELKLPLPTKLRLRTYFENTADAVQEFVSRVSRTDWPAPGAKPRARATDDQVHVWYGSGDESSAALRWRPFDRHELNL